MRTATCATNVRVNFTSMSNKSALAKIGNAERWKNTTGGTHTDNQKGTLAMQEITYYCSFCDERETVAVPTSFATYCGGDVEDSACPEHAPAMAFLEDQCPGCVSGWGECGMFMAIGNAEVSEAELQIIREGRCPHRVNGTMAISRHGVDRVDLSTKSEAGEAFALAAMAYQQ